MGPLAILFLAAGGAAVAAAAASSGSKPTGSSGIDWRVTAKIYPSYPPPPPYYPPNIAATKYPLIQWTLPGQTLPVAGNAATDVRGEPWMALLIGPKTVGGWGGLGSCEGAPGVPLGHGQYPAMSIDSFVGEAMGEVMDPVARHWIKADGLACTYQWVQAKWDDGSSDWLDTLANAVKQYFIPLAITIAGSAIGGVGGALTAAALSAAWKIANGAKVTDALVDAYQQHLASEVEKTAYFKTYQTVVATYKQTKADLDAIRAEAMKLYGYSGLNTDEIRKAVEAGIGVARAKQLQDAAIAAVRMRAGDPYAGWLDNCLAHNVMLQDWAIAMYGTRGADLLKWAFQTAGAALDAGRDPIVAVTPQFKTIPIAIPKVTTAGLARTRRKVA